MRLLGEFVSSMSLCVQQQIYYIKGLNIVLTWKEGILPRMTSLKEVF